MDDDAALSYVRAAAAALGLALDEARVRSVAAQLARTATLAQQLDEVALAPDAELAEIFRPAPFPDGDPPADPGP